VSGEGIVITSSEARLNGDWLALTQMGLDTANEVIALSVMYTEYTDPNMTLSWTKVIDKSASGQARGMWEADETMNVQTGVCMHEEFSQLRTPSQRAKKLQQNAT